MGNKTIRPVIIPIQKLIEFLLPSYPRLHLFKNGYIWHVTEVCKYYVDLNYNDVFLHIIHHIGADLGGYIGYIWLYWLHAIS